MMIMIKNEVTRLLFTLLFWSLVITGENYVGLAADVWDFFGEMREKSLQCRKCKAYLQ